MTCFSHSLGVTGNSVTFLAAREVVSFVPFIFSFCHRFRCFANFFVPFCIFLNIAFLSSSNHKRSTSDRVYCTFRGISKRVILRCSPSGLSWSGYETSITRSRTDLFGVRAVPGERRQPLSF